MDNNEKYLSLRRQYPVFEYEAYHYSEEPDGLHLWFDFRMGDIEFHPTAVVERRPFLDFGTYIDDIVFNILVATINDDGISAPKAEFKNEINMSPIKIVPQSDGWAFVRSTS